MGRHDRYVPYSIAEEQTVAEWNAMPEREKMARAYALAWRTRKATKELQEQNDDLRNLNRDNWDEWYEALMNHYYKEHPVEEHDNA